MFGEVSGAARRGGGGVWGGTLSLVRIDVVPPSAKKLQLHFFPLTDVDRGLAGDNLGRQRRELGDIERCEVLFGSVFFSRGERELALTDQSIDEQEGREGK